MLARGRIPDPVRQVLRLGRMTALRKKGGGVRGIVAGEAIRRLTARTIAKQLGPAVKEATAPFQYALSTRSGCECVAHVLQALTELDPETSARTTRCPARPSSKVWKGSLEEVPFSHSCVCSIHPLLRNSGQMKMVRCTPSTREREESKGMLSCLFSSVWAKQEAIQRGMSPDEKLLAFLDDLYVVSRPQRVGTLHSVAQRELWAHCRMRVHGCKTHTNQRRATGCREWQKFMTPQLGVARIRGASCRTGNQGFGHTGRSRRVRAFVVGEDSG